MVMQQIISRAGNNLTSLPNSSSYLLYGPCCISLLLEVRDNIFKESLKINQKERMRDFFFSQNQSRYTEGATKLLGHPQPPLTAYFLAIPSCTSPYPLPWGISFLQKKLIIICPSCTLELRSSFHLSVNMHTEHPRNFSCQPERRPCPPGARAEKTKFKKTAQIQISVVSSTTLLPQSQLLQMQNWFNIFQTVTISHKCYGLHPAHQRPV